MKIYLVGGAVRDQLLGRDVKERDWLVVGATVDEMLALGYQAVGKTFPVFLHPETREEYALARTERKTAPGYKGFIFHADPSVTLEQDLQRRDLTINAMAQTESGEIIDLYNGRHDLENRILRHVSAAFVEDPVRVLRIARFAARYQHLDFRIADETLTLMHTMVNNKEVDHLIPERVWQEFYKALQEDSPAAFIQTLVDSQAISSVLGQTFNADEASRALNIATPRTDDPLIRFATTIQHFKQADIKAFCEKLRTPAEYRNLALLANKHLSSYKKVVELPPPDVLQLLKSVDAFRKPERFEQFLLASELICRAEPGREHWPQPQREYLHTALTQAQAITAKDITKTNLEGKALAQELDNHRRAAISKVKQTYRWAKFQDSSLVL